MFKIKKRNHSFDCVFFINYYCRVPIPLFGVFIDTQSKLTNEKVSDHLFVSLPFTPLKEFSLSLPKEILIENLQPNQFF